MTFCCSTAGTHAAHENHASHRAQICDLHAMEMMILMRSMRIRPLPSSACPASPRAISTEQSEISAPFDVIHRSRGFEFHPRMWRAVHLDEPGAHWTSVEPERHCS